MLFLPSGFYSRFLWQAFRFQASGNIARLTASGKLPGPQHQIGGLVDAKKLNVTNPNT